MAERTPAPAPRRPPRVALVVKRSAWKIYREERKDPRITRLIEAGDSAVARLKASHEAHEQTVREFRLTSHGVSVGPVLEEFHGILSGMQSAEGSPSKPAEPRR